MALPKLDTPLHKGKLASSGKEVTFRPFKVKEEKILMLAAEGGEYEEMVNACAQIVGNCCEDVDAYTMPLFDLQDLFLQIRVQSHGAQADFRLFCGNEDCNEIVNYTMDLSEFKVEGLEDRRKDLIEVPGAELAIKLKYPGADVGMLINKLEDIELITKCIEYVVDGEETFSLADETDEEITRFVEDLPLDTFNEMKAFFTEMPLLKHNVDWQCKACGRENSVDINGYDHFFA